MTTRTRLARIATGIVVAAVAAVPAYAGPGTPSPAPSEQDQAAIRWQALNVLYGLGKPDEMTHAQYRAALIRSAALNERYGLPVAFTSDQVARLYASRAGEVLPETPAAPTTVEPTSADGFALADATIVAAFAVGLFLLGAAGALVVRRHGHVAHTRHR